ncbi:MAG TPA: gamma-glutamylcyclotransferase [Streptosporangiaceae bacterium]|nr:gamma-glutamylcyclotransferase [Streptosporangiaceae bacterium]
MELVAETATAPLYRLYSVGDRYPALQLAREAPDPAHPGSAQAGSAIAGEVYDLPLDVLRDDLLPAEPPELELGVIQLDDGEFSFAMVLRDTEHEGGRHQDITGFGSWRAYREGRPAPD